MSSAFILGLTFRVSLDFNLASIVVLEGLDLFDSRFFDVLIFESPWSLEVVLGLVSLRIEERLSPFGLDLEKEDLLASSLTLREVLFGGSILIELFGGLAFRSTLAFAFAEAFNVSSVGLVCTCFPSSLLLDFDLGFLGLTVRVSVVFLLDPLLTSDSFSFVVFLTERAGRVLSLTLKNDTYKDIEHSFKQESCLIVYQ